MSPCHSIFFNGLDAQFAAGPDFFFVVLELPDDAHSGLLVQAQCAGDVLGIHAQAYLAMTPAMELAKCRAEQRQAHPALARRAAHPQAAHVTAVGVVGRPAAAQGKACDLVPFHRKEPQAAIEERVFEEEF